MHLGYSVLLQVRVTRVFTSSVGAFRKFGEMSGQRAVGSVSVDKGSAYRASRDRYFCEVLQMRNRKRKASSPSRERKRIRLCEERRPRRPPAETRSRRNKKRSFSEMTGDVKCPRGTSVPRKRWWRDTGEAVKNTEAPRTSAGTPAPGLRVKRRSWNLCSSKVTFYLLVFSSCFMFNSKR